MRPISPDAPRPVSDRLHVVREHANPDMIGLVFEASDVDRAKAMMASPDLDKMQPTEKVPA